MLSQRHVVGLALASAFALASLPADEADARPELVESWLGPARVAGPPPRVGLRASTGHLVGVPVEPRSAHR